MQTAHRDAQPLPQRPQVAESLRYRQAAQHKIRGLSSHNLRLCGLLVVVVEVDAEVVIVLVVVVVVVVVPLVINE